VPVQDVINIYQCVNLDVPLQDVINLRDKFFASKQGPPYICLQHVINLRDKYDKRNTSIHICIHALAKN